VQAVSIHAHMYEVTERLGHAKLYYRAALDAEKDNPDYQADFERCRTRFHDWAVESHVRNEKAVREQCPNVYRPPIEESTKRFRESLSRPHEHRDPQELLNVVESARFAMVQQHLFIGRQAMEAGRWEEAQAEFVRAWKMADEHWKRISMVHLNSALRKELLGIPPLKPEPPPINSSAPDAEAEGEDDEVDEPLPGPLARLPAALQGVVWCRRGVSLADLHRFEEAFHALDEAVRLAPDMPEHAEHRVKVAEFAAKKKAEEEQRFPVKQLGTRSPTPQKVYTTTVAVGFAIRDGTHLPPVVIPPRYYSQPSIGRTK